MRRTTTQTDQDAIVEDVMSFLELAPSARLEDAVEQCQWSRSSVQRALRAHGTSFSRERRSLQLDRAAEWLLKQSAPDRAHSLREAAHAAGSWRPRHLCGPFRERYGLTPGEVWRLGRAVRALHSVARSPQPHSRRESAAYLRRRRRIGRLSRKLEEAREVVVPGSVVAKEIDRTLALNFNRKPPRDRQRARPRLRKRRRKRS